MINPQRPKNKLNPIFTTHVQIRYLHLHHVGTWDWMTGVAWEFVFCKVSLKNVLIITEPSNSNFGGSNIDEEVCISAFTSLWGKWTHFNIFSQAFLEKKRNFTA